MLQVVVRCVLAAVLVVAVLAKLVRPRESRDALLALAGLRGFGERLAWQPFAGHAPPRDHGHAPGAALAWLTFGALLLVELSLAAGVAAGIDLVAVVASVYLLAGAAVLGLALSRGRAGTPCACFGARSKVSRFAVWRALVLAALFLAVPFVPDVDPSTDTWLIIGLGAALAGVAVLAVALLALAREVGMLRLAVGPQAALEVPEEGPPLGFDTALAPFLDPRSDSTVIGLAVFTSEGCRLCQQLAPAIHSLGRDPHVDLLLIEEVRDAEIWERLNIPGSPFAVALDSAGLVLAKGTFNSLPQLESVLATAERRRAERSGV